LFLVKQNKISVGDVDRNTGYGIFFYASHPFLIFDDRRISPHIPNTMCYI